mgnify:CR=1 FL=1
MTEETKPTLNIDGTEHVIDDLDDTQKRTLNHIADLNNKISTASFQLEQLKIAQKSGVKHHQLGKTFPQQKCMKTK